MLRGSLFQCYQAVLRSQFALPALILITVFSFVAIGQIAERASFAFAGNGSTGAFNRQADGPLGSTSSRAANASASTSSNNSNSSNKTTGSNKSNSTSSKAGSNKTSTSNSAGTSATSTSSTGTQSTTSTSSSKSKAVSPTPAPAPAPSPAPAASWAYPLHSGIRATWFYAGEPAGPDNGYIQNVSSAWQDDWQSHFGGSDNPNSRCGYNPCGFTPHENPFYFALPFNDYTDNGPKSNLSSIVYWWNPGSQATLNSGGSILKNRWIQINYGSKTAYAQWEDVGPYNENNSGYVFGSSGPAYSSAGLDISPGTRDYLGTGDTATISWRFVTDAEVPAGPWKTIVTTSGPDWN